MKIAFMHFWTLRLPRGVETLTISLANALATCGEDVTILTAKRTRSPLITPLPQVKLEEFPTFRYYEATTIIPFYTAALIQQKFDVVVTYFADFGEGPSLALAGFLQPKSSCAHILYLTFPYEAAPHRYHAYRQYGWGERAKLILADAEYTARVGGDFFKRPVSLLPSGTDPGKFRPNVDQRRQMRTHLGFADQDVVLLNVAALEPRKGVRRVIDALPAILATYPNIRYLILGDGSERSSLEKKVVDLGVSHAVTFAGTTDNLPPYYNAADIFVLLSEAEAGSIALLEAMASGLPVIVSDQGGFAEVVGSTCGIRIDIDSQVALVSAVSHLVESPVQRELMGTNARDIILHRFSWESIANQFLSLIEKN